MKQESLDILVALGFPREVFRFQPACHNKAVMVDGKIVMFGSHNWSNEGVKTNRDASLISTTKRSPPIWRTSMIMTGAGWPAHPATSRRKANRHPIDISAFRFLRSLEMTDR